MNSLPDVFIGHYEGFAERLCCVEPDSGIFLHRSCELSGDRSGAGVQGAGDGRKQRFIWTRRADTYAEDNKGAKVKLLKKNYTFESYKVVISFGKPHPVSL